MTQPVDKSILQEIVRVIEAQRKVPERVVVRSREYLITYLEDHMNRLQEALRRYDSDRLNMLYGQLASKVKYQMHRMVASRAKEPSKETVAKAPKVKPTAAPAAKVAKKPAVKKPAAKKPAAKKPAVAKKAVKKVGKKPAPAAKAVKKTAAKKTARSAAKSHK